MEISSKILNTLKKCIHCCNHLSIFPININDHGGYICGRCEDQAAGATQILAYESLAGIAKFPCNNENLGCTVATTPDKMVNHERKCNYKQYDCFEQFDDDDDCEWKGILKNIKSHYVETHKDLVKTTDEYFKHKGKSCRVLVVDKNDVFLFQLKVKDTGFTADVYLIHGKHASDYYKYNLHFQLDSNEVVNLQEQKVKSMYEFSSEEGTVVEVIDLKKSDSCKIKFVIPSKVKTTLDEFWCKKCEKYITPPYYRCPAGHPVCDHIKSNGYYCHLCATKVKNKKRIPYYDKLLTTNKFNCFHPGCNATFLITESIHHEKTCKFKPHKCPLPNCDFKDTVDLIIEHLSDKHKGQYFINSLTTNLFCPPIKDSVVVQNDSIFKVLVSTSSVNKLWKITVNPYGPEHTRFMTELHMESQNLEERIHFKTYKCILLPKEMFTETWTSTIKIIEL